jgi:uncharacterized protein YgbK (DUF1537 family)
VFSGEFTGPDITFVYPDFRTGIRGTFHKGVLVHGVEVEITATRCRPNFREIQTKVTRELQRDVAYLC